MARTLTAVCAVVLALGLSGCDPEFCTGSAEDPIAAILVGLLCAGVDPPEPSPPQAAFTMSPNPAAEGTIVTFDASASKDPAGRIVRYEWDLNGFGVDGPLASRYEVDAGDDAVIRRRIEANAPTEPLERSIGLRVTDSVGNVDVIDHTLTINPGGLVASFTVSPNPSFVGQTVTFDASDSSSGFYEWDLDGNGTYEASSSVTPSITHVYATAGAREIGLRVTDIHQRTAETKRAVAVIDSRAVASTAAKRRGFRARLTRVRLPDVLPAPRVRGNTTTLRGLAVRGRLVAPARRLGALRPFRRARWKATLTVIARGDDTRMRGRALATFPRGRGKACLRITMATRERGRPAGRVTVLGGTGDAARLRGGGRFRFGFRDGVPRLNGRLRASLGKARPLPRKC